MCILQLQISRVAGILCSVTMWLKLRPSVKFLTYNILLLDALNLVWALYSAISWDNGENILFLVYKLSRLKWLNYVLIFFWSWLFVFGVVIWNWLYYFATSCISSLYVLSVIGKMLILYYYYYYYFIICNLFAIRVRAVGSGWNWIAPEYFTINLIFT